MFCEQMLVRERERETVQWLIVSGLVMSWFSEVLVNYKLNVNVALCMTVIAVIIFYKYCWSLQVLSVSWARYWGLWLTQACVFFTSSLLCLQLSAAIFMSAKSVWQQNYFQPLCREDKNLMWWLKPWLAGRLSCVLVHILGKWY